MNIMFMKEFPDGSRTKFDLKIKRCFDYSLSRREILGLITTGTNECVINAKLHTIRPVSYYSSGEVKPCRCKEGMVLSFREWEGKPYRSSQMEFEKGVCSGSQRISIINGFSGRFVFVDGRELNDVEVGVLAINDGFDCVDDFFKWFNKSFEGWIIHWTDVRY